MRRRAGMYSGRIGEMVACGWRPAGLVGITSGADDGSDISPGCAIFEGEGSVAVVDGSGEGAEDVPCGRDDAGGGVYAGGLDTKKLRMEGCPLALVEGRDMFVFTAEMRIGNGVSLESKMLTWHENCSCDDGYFGDVMTIRVENSGGL